MKAAVYLGKERIETQELNMPELREGEVLIKVMASGICGTDVHIFHGAPGDTVYIVGGGAIGQIMA